MTDIRIIGDYTLACFRKVDSHGQLARVTNITGEYVAELVYYKDDRDDKFYWTYDHVVDITMFGANCEEIFKLFKTEQKIIEHLDGILTGHLWKRLVL